MALIVAVAETSGRRHTCMCSTDGRRLAAFDQVCVLLAASVPASRQRTGAAQKMRSRGLERNRPGPLLNDSPSWGAWGKWTLGPHGLAVYGQVQPYGTNSHTATPASHCKCPFRQRTRNMTCAWASRMRNGGLLKACSRALLRHLIRGGWGVWGVPGPELDLLRLCRSWPSCTGHFLCSRRG